jgi:hypothetical protein
MSRAISWRPTAVRWAFAAVALSALVVGAGGTAAAASPVTRQATAVTSQITSGLTASATASTGDPCETSWTKYSSSAAGNLLYSFEASTYWCWNGAVVTSHKTSYHYVITSLGTLDGYGWDSGDITFNCYVASGSTRSCSGNHESVNGNFGIEASGFTVAIDQSENYKGQYFHSISILRG